MKRVINITLFCFLISIKGTTQIYFNKRLNVANLPNTSLNFLQTNDTFYISTQVEETPIPSLSFSTTMLKVDFNSNIISQKRFKNYNQYYSAPLFLYKFKKSFYNTVNTGSGNQVVSGLIKYKENGDTINTYCLTDTTFYNYGQKIIQYTKSKDKLLIIGITDSTCGTGHQGTYKAIIRVVDTNGVLLQTKMYLSNCFYRNISSVDTSENKGYLIGYTSMFSSWDADSRVMKLDSDLNVVWNVQINVTAQGISNIVNHKNQYYIVLSTKRDSVWNFSYQWGRVSLTKLDLNGNIVWQKYYGVKERPILTSGIKECANGDFIMSGTRRISYNELQGWIMRTDSLGNLKWWHNYRPNTTPILDTVADNYLYDIMELPNGDIAAVGWAGQSSISPLQQTWLLKVDSNGCFGSSNCPPNLITGVEKSITNNVGLTAYPNPFKDELNINYSILDFEGVAELQLIELASGRLIDNIELTQSFGTKQFNTENLASGLYVLSLKQNNKPSVNFKVINIK